MRRSVLYTWTMEHTFMLTHYTYFTPYTQKSLTGAGKGRPPPTSWGILV